MKNYKDVITEYWPEIMHAWHDHKTKHPVIECNLAQRNVSAFPSKEYINTLSRRTRLNTFSQFEQVTAQDGMMVFINDPDERILQSYVFQAEDIEPEILPNNETKMK